ncbi:hypothetical protein ACRAWG_05755 [Methylobacterium sp. P31]
MNSLPPQSGSPLPPSDHFAFGDPDKLRATIAELMVAVAMRANMVDDYAYLRDDAGLRHSMTCAAAEFRVALNLLGELTKQTKRAAERRSQPTSPTSSTMEGRP